MNIIKISDCYHLFPPLRLRNKVPTFAVPTANVGTVGTNRLRKQSVYGMPIVSTTGFWNR